MSTFYLDFELGNDANDGSNWANAWKTITSGATAARIAPGDVIRIAKSPDPVNIGNGTWTNLSKTVTLATAQTATIDNCETAWTAQNGATVTAQPVATDAKQGSYCMQIAVDTTPATNQLQAYYTIASTNFSAYQNISLWVKPSVALADANRWKVCLCSDTAGTTIVDTFEIIALPTSNYWYSLTLTKVGGGNLGAAIQSVALYTGSSAPTNSSNLRLDNIIACTTSGLCLNALISKSSAAQNATAEWYPIQSIDGTTVLIDNSAHTLANAGRGYSGTTETVTTYFRQPIMPAISSGNFATLQDSGTEGNYIEYQGGYNTGSSSPDGETWVSNRSPLGIFLTGSAGVGDFSKFNYFNAVRFNNLINLLVNNTIYFDNFKATAAVQGINFGSNAYLGNAIILNNNFEFTLFNNGFCNNIVANNSTTTGSGCSASSYSIINTAVAKNNAAYGARANTGIIINLTTADNATAGLQGTGVPAVILKATINEAAEASGFTNYANARTQIDEIDGTDYSIIYTDNGYMKQQAATIAGTGAEWVLYPTNSIRSVNYPLDLKIARVAVNSGALVTVVATVKKSHATDIACKLACRGGQVDGVASDVTTASPSDTNTNDITITFTPSEKGVVDIELWAYWVANAADENVIVRVKSITQA